MRSLRYTVHLPFWTLDPSSPVEGIRRSSVDVLAETVFHLALLEPDVCVPQGAGLLAAEFLTLPGLPEAARTALMRRS
ncbi:MAG: hypothetical protein J7452_09070 [Thermoflexus sp.]|jgi:hypothetical protein|nr:hypothetical protein [Thermoflexus sp.]